MMVEEAVLGVDQLVRRKSTYFGDIDSNKHIDRTTRSLLIKTLSSLISSITDILEVDPETRQQRDGRLKDDFFDIFVFPALKMIEFVGVSPNNEDDDLQSPQVSKYHSRQICGYNLSINLNSFLKLLNKRPQ